MQVSRHINTYKLNNKNPLEVVSRCRQQQLQVDKNHLHNVKFESRPMSIWLNLMLISPSNFAA